MTNSTGLLGIMGYVEKEVAVSKEMAQSTDPEGFQKDME